MTTEVLAVPELHLREVIKILRRGMKGMKVSKEVRENLTTWCDEEEEYLNHNGEDEE